jgi:hypothetical protein
MVNKNKSGREELKAHHYKERKEGAFMKEVRVRLKGEKPRNPAGKEPQDHDER